MSQQPSPGERRRPPVFPPVALLLCLLAAVALNIPPDIFSRGYRVQAEPPEIPPTTVLGATPSAAPAPSPTASPKGAPAPAAPAPEIPATVVLDPNATPMPSDPSVPVIPPTVVLDPNAPPSRNPPATIDGNPPRTDPPRIDLTRFPAGPAPVNPPPRLPDGERDGDGIGPQTSLHHGNDPHEFSRSGLPARNWIDQTQAQADAKSVGCLNCHHGVEPMHKSASVVLGCTDCHGGDATKTAKDGVVDGVIPGHVKASYPEYWRTAANPANSHTILNHENAEFIRFVNPGDLRVAQLACGLCHEKSFEHVARNMMNTGQMLWGAALYNNGGYWKKNYAFGQAYGRDGAPLRLESLTRVSAEMTKYHGVLQFLQPLPRFNLSQPGNILRVFEKGGVNPPELANPEKDSDRNGAPERALSARGDGTLLRTDPVFLGLQKTRLNDPLLGFLGTNDHPGDFRSSGCTACHTVYANDRSPTNSGWYSQYGHQGLSFSHDPTIDKRERGHPIAHQLTRSIPSSQCMSCHMHQGNLFVNPYLGYTWWDQESDGEFMYPKKQHDPTDAELLQSVRGNPEAAAARGLWGQTAFLEKVAELNPMLKHTQFADYHGHGWVFKAVFKKDRQGNLLDKDDKHVAPNDPHKWQKAVHLNDVHLQKGMQCVDCHFLRDSHGDGTLYNEPRAATSIECIDCHGTVDRRATLVTSGNGGNVNLADGGTPFGPRFVWRDKEDIVTVMEDGQSVRKYVKHKALYQYSSMLRNAEPWEVPQTIDTVNPASPRYNAKSAYAKTLSRDATSWGSVPADKGDRLAMLAHNEEKITCQVCHSSWATSCFGCHLPMKANQKTPLNKFEGTTDRNFTTYNPQVVRDDVFMLGIDGTVKKNRMAVLRSSSAVVVGSQNSNREWVYSQQQTVSAEGYSGQAFNPHFPHTTSGVGTTKGCTDCHLSAARDNNAWMTQLLGFGTGTVNFFGRYAWVGAGQEGIRSVVWTEQEEPQAAIGSHLHRLAYPKNFQEHVAGDRELHTDYEHKATDCRDLTQRGEFLYTANGKGGFRMYDIANIDNKAFSERFSTSPVSPLGENLHVQTKGIATSLALPSTLGLDPLREHLEENEETPIPLYYGWIYGTDTVEGLVIIGAAPLVTGNPEKRFLKKDATFNPEGLLTGATFVASAGGRLYITSPQGLSVVSVAEKPDPTHPKLLGHYGGSALKNPRAVAIQFQYAFVTDDEGMKVFSLADPAHPVPVPGATIPLAEAGRLYVARTYAYVADGKDGLAIIDVERPEHPRVFQMYTADGKLNDVRAVQIGSISASMFALVADGRNGLRVIQMISPENVPENAGFSPKPNPILIATAPVKGGEAIAVGRGLDRDRIVDETGAQTVVFGRRGSRPFSLKEMSPFLRHLGTANPADPKAEHNGAFYRVQDVTVSRDDAGVQTLHPTDGGSLHARADFRDPSSPPAAPSDPLPMGTDPYRLPTGPVNPYLQLDEANRLAQPLPPGPANPYLRPDDANRLIQPPSPTVPPDRSPGPQPSASPGPANPYLQQDEANRLLDLQPGASPKPTPQAKPSP